MLRSQVQIDRYRKGTALIRVENQDGEPCAGVAVSVEQETQAFQFGCVVLGLGDATADDRQRLERRARELFNVVQYESECGEIEHNDRSDMVPVDLSHVRERVHLARLSRELDRRGNTVQGEPRKLLVYVSGRTVGLGHDSRQHGMSTDDETREARLVAGLYTLCFSHPSLGGVFWRGVSDREEGVDGRGLLRRDLSPKRSHQTLRKLIHVIWHSRASGTTDGSGLFRFRGLFGSYRVVVASPQQNPTVAQLSLREGGHEFVITIPPRLP